MFARRTLWATRRPDCPCLEYSAITQATASCSSSSAENESLCTTARSQTERLLAVNFNFWFLGNWGNTSDVTIEANEASQIWGVGSPGPALQTRAGHNEQMCELSENRWARASGKKRRGPLPLRYMALTSLAVAKISAGVLRALGFFDSLESGQKWFRRLRLGRLRTGWEQGREAEPREGNIVKLLVHGASFWKGMADGDVCGHKQAHSHRCDNVS